MSRQHISDGIQWEAIVGYCRAIRVGNQIEVAGTTAVDGREVIAPDDVYEQTKFILRKIEQALEKLGTNRDAIVRTRLFITDIEQWEKAGKAHGEFFQTNRPVTTIVEVSKLIQPDLLIEIEATAIVED